MTRKATKPAMADAQSMIAQAGESVRAEIAGVREQIEALKAEQYDLQHGPLPLSDVTERINALIDGQAADFDLEYNLSALTHAGRKLGDADLFSVSVRPGPYETGSGDLGPLLCALFGDAIKQRLTEFAKSLDLDGVPLAERPKLIAKLEKEIYALEVQEEALICQAEAAGIACPRHPDCSPAVVLEWRP